MVAGVQTRLITSEEFAAMPEIDAAYVELIEGEIIVAGGASFPHQMRSWNMILFLGTHITTGTWLAAPMAVRFSERSTFEPDMFWIAPDNTACALLDERTWGGAPDLVIEILSPSTARRDRDHKFRVYEASGVREYWLVEPEADFLEIYTLQQGKYARQGVYGVGEAFASGVLGIQVDVNALFKMG